MFRLLRSILTLAVATLVVLAAAVPAAADGTDRPFKGSITGLADVSPDPGCEIGLRTLSWGTGQATHLGLTTMTSSHCTSAGLSFAGVGTFVAADGSLLETTYTATAEPFDFVEGAVMNGSSHNVITGGTGRFAGASGEFDMVFRGILHFTQPMELSWWWWDGEISY